jgi:hypothetical protein
MSVDGITHHDKRRGKHNKKTPKALKKKLGVDTMEESPKHKHEHHGKLNATESLVADNMSMTESPQGLPTPKEHKHHNREHNNTLATGETAMEDSQVGLAGSHTKNLSAKSRKL